MDECPHEDCFAPDLRCHHGEEKPTLCSIWNEREHLQSASPVAGSYTAHAVRWGKRETALGTVWTKWHGTDDASTTWCGRKIPVIKDEWPNLPETDEDLDRITCKVCQKQRSAV